MGARKFGIIPSGLLGCCPYSRALNKSSGGCMKEMNQFSKAFYTTVNSIFRNMSSQFPDFHYSLANIYSMTRSVLKNYRLLGFNETKKACCGSGYDNGEGFCNKEQMSNLCDNRAVHLFWDLYHPSQAATNFSAATLLYGERPFVSPVNFSTLAGLKA
ncbi:GDSL esterase/lipase At2g23540-like [Mercurialis annua]|uniref:GDSL esterase/lipase At2g23540-like n=1 Tax=Mercurialis annua TaxID=3986 RepID=UPI0024AE78FD|nr:GDSL esterase/lipase At2g23540-like [Mercurialis annua]